MRLTRRGAIVVALLATLLAPHAAVSEPLTTDQALALAAKQNPSLAAALLDVTAAQHAVTSEERARVPVFVGSVSGTYAESLGADTRTDSESVSASAAFQFFTDIGTTIETGVESSIGWRNANAFGTLGSPTGPTTSADVYVSVRQPLLRGAGEDAVLGSLMTARESVTQAELERDVAASELVRSVLRAYWELWYAEEAIRVQEEALALAERQVGEAEARDAALGTGSRLEILQFSSSAASIEDALSSARTTRDTRAIELGTTLGLGPSKALSLSASTAPPASIGAPDLPDEATLVERSPELAGLRSQLRSSDIRIETLEDTDQHRLDVFGRVSMGGLWTEDAYAGLSLPGGRPAFTATAGLELEIPMGERSASAEVSRARTQKDATVARYRARVDAIVAEASSLSVELGAANRQVSLSEKTAKISEELAEAERQLLGLGTGSPTDVVKAEQSAREARLRHLRAIVSRATAELDFEHTTGALLGRHADVMSKETR